MDTARLQERRFTSIRSADDKDSEMTNAIKLLFDCFGIQMNRLGHVFDTWGVVYHHVYIPLIDDDQDRSLTTTHSFA